MFGQLRKAVPASVGTVVIGLMCAASASASTVVGQTFAPTYNCPSGSVFQSGVAAGTSYAVPSDGVITSWSIQAGSPAGQLRFEVFRSANDGNANDFTEVAQDPVNQTLTPSTLNTFPTRLAVKAGDMIGFNPTGTACAVIGDGNVTDTLRSSSSEPGNGNTASFTAAGQAKLDLAAKLEPDADGDGFGDETQDQCPSDASTHGPCPAPSPPVIVAPPPVPFAGIQLHPQTATAKNGEVTLTLPCPASSQGGCVGTDTLTTAGKVVAPRVNAAKKKAKILTLGKGSLSIAAGTNGTVTIKLNKAALKLLAKKHTLKVKQTIVAHDSRNLATTTSGNLKIKAAKPKKKH